MAPDCGLALKLLVDPFPDLKVIVTGSSFNEQPDWINYNGANSNSTNRVTTFTTGAFTGVDSLSRDAGSSYTFTSVLRINSINEVGTIQNLSMMLFAENVGNDQG